jgi:undecaprenyl diphosphate synthase
MEIHIKYGRTDRMKQYKRLPKHIGIIPDGNRRWAENNGMNKEDGYNFGISPGLELYKECVALGVKELTFYGFTQDNTKRPAVQTKAFQKACVDSVLQLANFDANLLVIGKSDSPSFPKDLLPFTKREQIGKGLININFLVNYGWEWDLTHAYGFDPSENDNIANDIASSDISRIDLIIRWGNRRRLSGFLPVQSVYADFYVVDDMWPDFNINQFHKALEWYQEQDVTLGG